MFFKKRKTPEQWLKQMGITQFSIREDNTIDVYEHVMLSGNIPKLPVKFGIIEGNFYCFNVGLTTLEGCPYKVTGSFRCDKNQLNSLKYGPNEVGGEFDCSNNNLTSLEYCPKKIGGSLICIQNKLITLKGCPVELGDSLNCNMNFLISIIYCPRHIKGFLACAHNDLISFDGFPEKVDSFILFGNNKIGEHELKNFNTIVNEGINQDIISGDKEEFLKIVNAQKIIAEKEHLINLNNTSISKELKKHIRL
ncbi:hypothetical protein G714_04305 [Escherichia coli HVH 39 (4-2679949)]|uniref:hypothetical protein n=1 Tax=Escherichia coli TaxID=562 RepID=UPI00038F5151|nr:hypothetical protein [Escherichia coli]EQO38525.1 hypothetical protein G714_04305 [Escherichia coli HVH 39 (4-2679949)]